MTNKKIAVPLEDQRIIDIFSTKILDKYLKIQSAISKTHFIASELRALDFTKMKYVPKVLDAKELPYQVALDLVRRHPVIYENLPANFKNRIALIKLYVNSGEYSVANLPLDLIAKHRDLVEVIIKNDGEDIRLFQEDYSADKDLANLALKQTGKAIRYIHEEKFSSDDYLDMVLTGIKGNSENFHFLSIDMKMKLDVVKTYLNTVDYTTIKTSQLSPEILFQSEVMEFLLYKDMAELVLRIASLGSDQVEPLRSLKKQVQNCEPSFFDNCLKNLWDTPLTNNTLAFKSMDSVLSCFEDIFEWLPQESLVKSAEANKDRRMPSRVMVNVFASLGNAIAKKELLAMEQIKTPSQKEKKARKIRLV